MSQNLPKRKAFSNARLKYSFNRKSTNPKHYRVIYLKVYKMPQKYRKGENKSQNSPKR